MNDVPNEIGPTTKIKRLNTGEVKTIAEWNNDFPTLEAAIAAAIETKSTQARVETDDGDAHFIFVAEPTDPVE